MALPRALIAILILFLGATAGAASEKRIALVIGNSAYISAGKLGNPINDATDIAAKLTRLGFDASLVLDADAPAFVKAIDQFMGQARDADIAVFYYAGHGLQYEGGAYLLPTDAKLESEFAIRRETVAAQEIVTALESSAKAGIVILDACRSNPLADRLRESLKGRGRAPALSRGLGRIEASAGNMLVVYSAAPGQEAQDGDGRNSPFTAAFLKHAETKGLEVEQMLKQVTAEVEKATKGTQQPERLSRLKIELWLNGEKTGFEVQLTAACREQLKKWRSSAAVGAFAVDSEGAVCGSSSDLLKVSVARDKALEACNARGSDCRVIELTEGDWSLKPACEDFYSKWKTEVAAKAFAVARSGWCASSTGRKQLEEAKTEALVVCERASGDCRLHDVDQGDWELSQDCKAGLEKFRKFEPARAFAVARNGSCGWSYDYINPTGATKSALEECEKSGTECRITESDEGNWQLDAECKKTAEKWLRMQRHGSFAAGKSGGCGYSYNYTSTSQADETALSECKSFNGNECKVVARR